MITRLFECREHEEYGSLGWRPLWMPMADPLQGMAVAHDVLEHQRHDDGSVEHELMALGARGFVRYAGDYFTHNNAYENLSSEWGFQVGYLAARGELSSFLLREPGRVPSLDDDHTDKFFRAGVADMLPYLLREYDEWTETHDVIKRDPLFETKAVGWLRKGYRRAKHRYGRYNLQLYNMCKLFKEIEQAADNNLQCAEEGMWLRVQVDCDRQYTKVQADYPCENDYGQLRWPR